jgi:DNA-binding MarR family transcriptional regulator
MLARRVEESIVLTLVDLSNHLQKRGERIARKAGLTAQQWLLLLHVAGDPPSPNGAPLASGIAEARGVSRASVSVLLEGLVRRRLVRRVAIPGDRRQRALVITPAGRRALRTLEPGRRRANRLLVKRLKQRRRRELLEDLRICLDTVLKEREEAYL